MKNVYSGSHAAYSKFGMLQADVYKYEDYIHSNEIYNKLFCARKQGIFIIDWG